uniref:Uncharacterized protein n=1 Tax=viral metagenome TaxID=1070528 RepID=A0A6C0BME6_9ZZZZ
MYVLIVEVMSCDELSDVGLMILLVDMYTHII